MSAFAAVHLWNVGQITVNLLEATEFDSVPAVIPRHYSETVTPTEIVEVARLLRPLQTSLTD